MAFKITSGPPATTIAVQLAGFLRDMEARAAQPCSATNGCFSCAFIAMIISSIPDSTIVVLTSSLPATALSTAQAFLAIV